MSNNNKNLMHYNFTFIKYFTTLDKSDEIGRITKEIYTTEEHLTWMDTRMFNIIIKL